MSCAPDGCVARSVRCRSAAGPRAAHRALLVPGNHARPAVAAPGAGLRREGQHPEGRQGLTRGLLHRRRRGVRTCTVAPPSHEVRTLADSGDDGDMEKGEKDGADEQEEARKRLEAAYAMASKSETPLEKLLELLTAMVSSMQGSSSQDAGATAGEVPPANSGAYAELAGEYDVEKLKVFFQKRPWEVALRLLEFVKLALRIQKAWTSEEEVLPEKRLRGGVLRAAVSELGPVFVKCGQTMAQRADLIGDEAADALKKLQSSNQPFPDELAWKTILADLGHDGPLSPDCPVMGPDAAGEPLFAKFQAEHIASASLGQVYKATTHDGRDIAIKVQRPNVLRQVALDMYVLRLGLALLRIVWGITTNLMPIADEVGTGLFKELDYHLEAKNASDFNRAHSFLGYVRAPLFIPEYTGPKGSARVLALEWISGNHIDKLEPERAKLMVAMAVEASVAQLLRTGFVHVDPHEGNMIFTPEDELCYIDFGLMARVDPVNMEAFASGVCHMLAGKYENLAEDFVRCGIAPSSGYMKYAEPGKLVECTREDFAAGLKYYMEGEEGGNTRFGALATGLAGMSYKYKLLTPPYIILLCRTFLTLEGIAAKVEPDFSIYTAALPFAVRRALSPETPRGKEALRSALLDDEGNFRFSYFSEVLQQTETLAGGGKDTGAPPVMAPSAERPGAKPQTGAETLTGLLGSSDGQPLRRVAKEANTLAMARTLADPSKGRVIRRQGSRALAAAIVSSLDSSSVDEPDLDSLPPAARVQQSLRQKEQVRMKRALKVIGGTHMRNLARGGPAGWWAMLKLFFVAVRVLLGALLHIVQDEVSACLRRWFGGSRSGSNPEAKPKLQEGGGPDSPGGSRLTTPATAS